jgi:hypothetical protein
MTAKKRIKSKGDANAVSVESSALLSLVADIRAAVGDPTGKLMQDELVKHCRKLAKAATKARKALADFDNRREAAQGMTPCKSRSHHAEQLIDDLRGIDWPNKQIQESLKTRSDAEPS